MKVLVTDWGRIIVCVVSAAVLWYFTFIFPAGNFWIKISISASLLAIAALWFTKDSPIIIRFNTSALIHGVLAAAVLYALFWSGQIISQKIFAFANRQIGGIYSMGEGMPIWIVALLLFFIIGPAEEIFWRGFLQTRLAAHFGQWQGWFMASALYAGVHIFTWNLMLIGAAAIAGLFWGFLYLKWKNLAPVIISHAVWSTVIFAVFPTM